MSVSIVIPCYNKVAYVAASIKSALAQTHSCEIIVVDDGSTDGSFDEIKRFEGRIRWITGPNRGGCAARNTGVAMSSGKYLQFLDADDILPSDKISCQIAALQDAPEGAVATCPWTFLRNDGRLEAPDARPFWRGYCTGLDMLLDMWIDGGFLQTSAWLVPRALANSSGPWNTNLAADQDGEYFGRILTRSGPVLFCSDTCVQYRHPPKGAITRDKSFHAAESRMRAFEIVAEDVLSRRSDRAARRACLSRIRKTGYSLREFDDMVTQAAVWETRLKVFDLSPSLPPVARWLIALLGIRRGLKVRSLLKS